MDDAKGFTTTDNSRCTQSTGCRMACEQKVMSNGKFDSVVLLKWNIHITSF